MEFRVGVIKQSGEIVSNNCNTLEKCYEYLLSIEYKKYRIINRETKELIETERGKVK